MEKEAKLNSVTIAEVKDIIIPLAKNKSPTEKNISSQALKNADAEPMINRPQN